MRALSGQDATPDVRSSRHARHVKLHQDTSRQSHRDDQDSSMSMKRDDEVSQEVTNNGEIVDVYEYVDVCVLDDEDVLVEVDFNVSMLVKFIA